MFVVDRACPRCAVRHTVNMSDGRPLCVNCTLRRIPSEWSRAGGCRARVELPAADIDPLPESELDPRRLTFLRYLLRTGRIGS